MSEDWSYEFLRNWWVMPSMALSGGVINDEDMPDELRPEEH